jgi:hypothetical protein
MVLLFGGVVNVLHVHRHMHFLGRGRRGESRNTSGLGGIVIANHRDPVTTSHPPGGKPEWASSDDHRHKEIGMSDLAAARAQVGLPPAVRDPGQATRLAARDGGGDLGMVERLTAAGQGLFPLVVALGLRQAARDAGSQGQRGQERSGTGKQLQR